MQLVGVLRTEANCVHLGLNLLVVRCLPGDLLLLGHFGESQCSIVNIDQDGDDNSQYLLALLVVVAIDCQQAVEAVFETTQVITLESMDEGLLIYVLKHPRLLLVLFNDALSICMQDAS